MDRNQLLDTLMNILIKSEEIRNNEQWYKAILTAYTEIVNSSNNKISGTINNGFNYRNSSIKNQELLDR